MFRDKGGSFYQLVNGVFWSHLEVPIKPVCNLPAAHPLIAPLVEQAAFVKRGDLPEVFLIQRATKTRHENRM